MTEAEWAGCIDLSLMLEFLEGKASDRKLRLFACGCARRIWERIGPTVPVEITLSERFADGLSSKKEMNQQWERSVLPGSPRSARAATSALEWILDDTEGTTLSEVADSVAEFAVQFLMFLAGEQHGFNPFSPETDAQKAMVEAIRLAEEAEQAALLHDIVGNPFRHGAVDPCCLAWSGRTVEKLALATYEERQMPSGHLDPSRLAILADALEEAGCTDPNILSHLRGPGPHVRGCWCVDLLLAKE